MDPPADRSSAELFQQRSFEAADHLACGLRAAREWLALPLARVAQEFMRQRAWLPFGFACRDDFARERLGRSGRWLRDLASLQDGLDAFPELAHAMVGRDGARPLGRVAALWIARTACAESISTWVRMARESSVRELREQVREARRAGSHAPPSAAITETDASADSPPSAASEADVFQRRCRGRLAVPVAVKVAFDEALDFHRAISGSETSVAEFVDAVAAEWETALPAPSRCQPGDDITLVALRRDRHRDERERTCDRARRRAPHADTEPGASAAARDVLQRVQRLSFEVWGHKPTPSHLVDQLQSLIQIENEIERRLGSLLADMQSQRAWCGLGFASLGHYAAERLGLARRTIETRAALARASSLYPILRAAYESGSIGLESALLVRRALGSARVDSHLEREWTEHASLVTVKRLRDELRLLGQQAAGLESERGGSAPAAALHPPAASSAVARSRFPRPPSDAAWHASLFRAPGLARERLARLGVLAIESTAGVHARSDNRRAANGLFTVELPEDVARRFFAAIESARLLLVELASSCDAGEPAPASLRAAQTFSRRGEAAPAWAGLLAVLEHFVDTWDRREHVPRREWDRIYRRDGYRCMAPGCTARGDLQAHHLWYRSHQGPDDPWNMLCLCWLHHQEGEHGGLARVRGEAPLGLVWRLGTTELASWYRNERRLERSTGTAAEQPCG